MNLVKTVRFDEDVVALLRKAEWSSDGLLCKLPQVERKLYEKVNKALDILGGKWNRKAGGHVFEKDPRNEIEGFIETKELVVERDGFFETPLPVVKRMLELLPFGRRHGLYVLEPSAGRGAILDHLLWVKSGEYHGYWAIEKNRDRANYLKERYANKPVEVFQMDFLKYKLPVRFAFDRIYANPPFENGQDIDHVRHAHSLLAPTRSGIVAVMSEGAFSRGDNKAREFREWLESVGGTSEKLPPKAFKESGTGVNTRLVLIKKDKEQRNG